MAEETGGKLLNGKIGWAVGGLGIPLAAILTWVFSAGQLSYITNQNATKINDLDGRVRTIESIESRRDAQYEDIIRRLAEIKTEMQQNMRYPQSK